ncbi:hypothetical protein G6F43_004923 [Rhizopus delemar]|nr:hypothetical protein G6F43_004923 [Rhizopus delemar]
MSTTEWTILEKLLLSQAIYKYGEDNWFQIARSLKHHALLDRPSDYFNQKSCSLQYYLMIEDLEKEKRSQFVSTQNMPIVIRLARQLYSLRLEELKKEINKDEEKFLMLISEIEDIRAGKLDYQFIEYSSEHEKNSESPRVEKTWSGSLLDKERSDGLEKDEKTEEERAIVENKNNQDAERVQAAKESIEIKEKENKESGLSHKSLENTPQEREQKGHKEIQNPEQVELEVKSSVINNNKTREFKADTEKTPDERNGVFIETDKKVDTINTDNTRPHPKWDQLNHLENHIKTKRLADDTEVFEEPRSKRSRMEDGLLGSGIQIESKIENEPGMAHATNTEHSADRSQSITPVDITDIKDGDESMCESNAPTPTNDRSNGSSKKSNKEDPRYRSWLKNISLLWREIANHKNGAMFMSPIKESIAPQYYDIIKKPMDLKTIKFRIRDGLINTTTEFERDVILMLTNSLMYNTEGTEVYQMAKEMLDDAAEQIRVFKTADEDTSAASTHTRAASMAAKERRKSLTSEL